MWIFRVILINERIYDGMEMLCMSNVRGIKVGNKDNVVNGEKVDVYYSESEVWENRNLFLVVDGEKVEVDMTFVDYSYKRYDVNDRLIFSSDLIRFVRKGVSYEGVLVDGVDSDLILLVENGSFVRDDRGDVVEFIFDNSIKEIEVIGMFRYEYEVGVNVGNEIR